MFHLFKSGELVSADYAARAAAGYVCPGYFLSIRGHQSVTPFL